MSFNDKIKGLLQDEIVLLLVIVLYVMDAKPLPK